MLNSLSIERFKSIRSANLHFGRINLLIGGNGSGKSNILEAIGLVSAALERGTSDADLRRKGVRLTPPELMKSAFKGYDLPKTLYLAANSYEDVTYHVHLTARQDDPLLEFFSESCTHGRKKMFGRSNHGATALGNSLYGQLQRHRSLWDQIRTAYKFPPTVDQALSSLSKFSIYSPQTDFLRGMQLGEVYSPPIGLHGEGLPEAVSGLLRQLHRSRVATRQRAHPTEMDKVTYALRRKAVELVFLPNWARQVSVGSIKEFLVSRGVLERGENMV